MTLTPALGYCFLWRWFGITPTCPKLILSVQEPSDVMVSFIQNTCRWGWGGPPCNNFLNLCQRANVVLRRRVLVIIPKLDPS